MQTPVKVQVQTLVKAEADLKTVAKVEAKTHVLDKGQGKPELGQEQDEHPAGSTRKLELGERLTGTFQKREEAYPSGPPELEE